MAATAMEDETSSKEAAQEGIMLSVSSSPSTNGDAVQLQHGLELVHRAEHFNAVPVKTKDVNKGAWTEEEDKKLAQVIAIRGAKKWKTLAVKAGINRCGKSCRLRWLNYLRPTIKRGNISAEEEDLILRLHKLLGNRWSLIAGRLPGRTDNEIKNYWNSCLSKKIISRHSEEKQQKGSSCTMIRQSAAADTEPCNSLTAEKGQGQAALPEEAARENEDQPSDDYGDGGSKAKFDMDEFFDFSNEDPFNLEWIQEFLITNRIKNDDDHV